MVFARPVLAARDEEADPVDSFVGWRCVLSGAGASLPHSTLGVVKYDDLDMPQYFSEEFENDPSYAQSLMHQTGQHYNLRDTSGSLATPEHRTPGQNAMLFGERRLARSLNPHTPALL